LAEWVEGFLQAQEAIENLAKDPVPAFTQQVDALDKTFQEAAKAATKYGLATDELNAAHARGLAELNAARAETLRATGVGLDVRRLRAQGRTQEADLLEFGERAASEVKALADSLDSLAVTAAQKSALLVQLEETQAAERADIVRRYAEEANAALRASGADIRSYINGLRAGTTGGASPTDRLAAAQQQFGTDLALARGGNKEAYDRITQTADLLLAAAGDMFASGPQFQAMRTFVMQSLENLPAVKSYDAEILDALSQLGGGVNVEVELEVVRVITEQLNALSDADRARLVSAQTVIRDVQERVGRFLTPAELTGLVQAAIVQREVRQTMGVDLSGPQRAGLVQGATVLRAIEQAMQRDLTLAERAGILWDADISRDIQQAMARDLSPAERAGLLQSAEVLRSIEQAMARDLSPAERAGLVQGAEVERLIEQRLGRTLTEAERAGLVSAGTVVRAVEQQLGRALTPAEQATIIQGGAVLRGIYQQIQAPTGAALLVPAGVEAVLRGIYQEIQAATGASLLEADTITRIIRQAVETTETVEISRSIDFKLTSIMNSMIALLEIIKSGVNAANGSLGVLMGRTGGEGTGGDTGGFGDFGGGGGGGGMKGAIGAVFNAGNVVPFARGGLPDLVSRATYAPMALFGEAGPEAIMPLGRDGSGRLGVRATGGVFSELLAELRALRQTTAQQAGQIAALQSALTQAVQQGATLVATEVRNGTSATTDAVLQVKAEVRDAA
jgi:hypothetical protein